MQNRRKFIKTSLFGAGVLLSGDLSGKTKTVKKPVAVSTWKFGLKANEVAWKMLTNNSSALDSVESGVRVVESDPTERSVGKGGRPDRDGKVTLDACIMDHKFNVGSVAFLEHIENPVSVARAVMEKTPHAMLVGSGALDFALKQGFKKTNLLVPESEKDWLEWLKKSEYKPEINIENHDTIGMLTLDLSGNLAGACTTSGLAWKMHGRVGDSPIIGAGLYVDNAVGAATATGHGEEVIRTVGSFRVVENMRHGMSPQKACEDAVRQIKKAFDLRAADISQTQIGFLAVNPKGETGAFALRSGFQYALSTNGETRLMDSKYLI